MSSVLRLPRGKAVEAYSGSRQHDEIGGVVELVQDRTQSRLTLAGPSVCLFPHLLGRLASPAQCAHEVDDAPTLAQVLDLCEGFKQCDGARFMQERGQPSFLQSFRAFVEEIGYGHIEGSRNRGKAAGAYPVGAALVFLDLLERNPNRIGELRLRYAQLGPAQPYLCADRGIDFSRPLPLGLSCLTPARISGRRFGRFWRCGRSLEIGEVPPGPPRLWLVAVPTGLPSQTSPGHCPPVPALVIIAVFRVHAPTPVSCCVRSAPSFARSRSCVWLPPVHIQQDPEGRRVQQSEKAERQKPHIAFFHDRLSLPTTAYIVTSSSSGRAKNSSRSRLLSRSIYAPSAASGGRPGCINIAQQVEEGLTTMLQRGASKMAQPGGIVTPDRVSWDDLRIFVVAARELSLRKAAAALRTSSSKVVRRIDRLEHALGFRLFDRLPDGIALTAEGRSVLASAQEMERASWSLRASLDQDLTTRGIVRCSVTEGLGTFWILPHLAEFSRTNPNTVIDLRCTMERADMLRMEADVAIQLVRPDNPDLVVAKLGRMHIYPFASRRYVESHGLPNHTGEMAQHRLVDQTGPQLDDGMLAKLLGLSDVEGIVSVRTNASTAHFYAVELGMGIGGLPTYALALGADVIPIDIGLRHEVDIWMTYHPDAKSVRRVALFVEWLRSLFDAKRYPWFRDEFIHPRELAKSAALERVRRPVATDAVSVERAAGLD